uniref:Uncharacterized protein n=1 Tax=Arundo donax TaxID=35708 RepID=A0A0A8XRW4_ARUDO
MIGRAPVIGRSSLHLFHFPPLVVVVVVLLILFSFFYPMFRY